MGILWVLKHLKNVVPIWKIKHDICMYLFWVKLETDAFLRVNNTFCVLLLWKTMIKFLRQHNPNTYQTLLSWVGCVILDVVLRQAVKYTMMSHFPVLLRKCYLLKSQQSHPNTHMLTYTDRLWKTNHIQQKALEYHNTGWDERKMKEVLLSLCDRKRNVINQGKTDANNPPPSFSLLLF